MPEANILFADNDPDFLKTRAEFLEQEGYRVIPAVDPTEARRKLESGGIDLAIIDIRLSDDDDEKDASGLILAKESDRTVPKIILTGFPSVNAVREALGPRLDGLPAAVSFVGKQEGPESLLMEVRRVLSSGGQRVTEASAMESLVKEVEVDQPKAAKSRKDWIRLAGGIVAIVTLLLALGTGIVSIVAGDPRWLLATIFLAILMVIGIGLAVFMP